MNVDTERNYTNKDFGDALKELIEAKGWSYKQLSDKASISKGYISQLINKEVLPPKDEFIIKIATAIDVKPEYFKEYRNRRLSEGLDTLNFHKDNYNVPLSREEVDYLKKIIKEAEKNF